MNFWTSSVFGGSGVKDVDVTQLDELGKECKCFGSSRQDFFFAGRGEKCSSAAARI